MAFTLPDLPYAFNALEPHIDAQTMQIHHGKHHAAYVNNVNKAIEGKANLESKTIEDLISSINAIPQEIRAAVRNNGGGHYNHTLFWEIMGPRAGGQPKGELADAIKADFGSFDAFKEKFSNAAATRFGSGWAWLTVSQGKLCVCSTPNQDSPLMDVAECKGIPILGIDVWEHAYYLKYQNRRPEYITAFWNLINWDAVAKRYKAVLQAR
ncbi:MAG: superoxide dismutase [Omnitrophica WOR_2 bacterium RIFCSPLOWO2_12_FULL_50_9]|nr:MAG: superoxide dismutase [Omnitrophica WOR_2 bacterium RIFCSPLOWO2_12_FULL_50_9]